ncbi:proheparin-binding EGF-like growth factor [Pundamilia nyererei]|uniref:Amphiregulin n=2 Tax=Haplochromini TaxID=319058 RepID=A0A3Q2WQ92_HAPBU|nr:PREDICTED: proheparin-binding EGF-like growth factor [Pundamilia nyererei]XP_005924537.1 proheparin-binding EGF-like growth factor [Haplochromis burtoni]XP_039906723.1 proheparin-binding EGF-like growth factor [Simochromis diagramma]XP_039906724.1 proheparin-binding EGF-like growth factor [Simochromis diagramma]
MNPLILTCFLCFVCSALSAQGSTTTQSGDQVGVTVDLASGEGLQNLHSDDDELEEDGISGGDDENVSFHDLHPNRDEKKKRKVKGKRRNKHKGKSTTPFNPEHMVFTSGHTSTLRTNEDPCNTSHLGYCIHGYCKHIDGLHEPVCICMKGYDGERCGIQTLGTVKNEPTETNNAELVQTVLVVIAVVLSVISCTAILLMTCAHYRSHKNFLASYLGTVSEQEKLQKHPGDVVV